MSSSKNRDLFDKYARDSAPDDFWRQVHRTVDGQVVDDAQIQLIEDAIVSGLALRPDDVVLDICCGNGALSDRIFERCAGGLGIDFSEGLIEIARANFERMPERAFAIGDVERFLAATPHTAPFTKALCFCSFQFLAPDVAPRVLALVRERFPAIRAFFVGDLPDRARMDRFYYPGAYVPGVENDHEAPLGMWRTEDEFATMARAAGWIAAFPPMPADYHAAHYRFNAVLTPAEPG